MATRSRRTWLWWTIAVAFVVAVTIAFLFGEGVPGLTPVLGFVGTVIIILVSKALGRWWLQRSQTYYERGEG